MISLKDLGADLEALEKYRRRRGIKAEDQDEEEEEEKRRRKNLAAEQVMDGCFAFFSHSHSLSLSVSLSRSRFTVVFHFITPSLTKDKFVSR